jgi:ribonuclease P protein component
MVTAKHRFHGLGSLKRVYQHGRNVRSSLFALKVMHNERRHDYRVAVVVSRKVHKSAVVRNRIRRRLYEQVRLQSPQITGPYDMVFTVFNEEVAELPTDKLKKIIADQLRQAGVTKP